MRIIGVGGKYTGMFIAEISEKEIRSLVPQGALGRDDIVAGLEIKIVDIVSSVNAIASLKSSVEYQAKHIIASGEGAIEAAKRITEAVIPPAPQKVE